MKKLIVILLALVCISGLGMDNAEASGDGLYSTVSPMILPISGQPGKFKVTFFGVLSINVFDGYTYPLPPEWNGVQEGMATDCGDCSFSIISTNTGTLPWQRKKPNKTTSFSVAAGNIFGGRWEPLTQSNARPGMTFKVRYRGPFLGNPEVMLDSEEFAICDIAGATSHIDICKPVIEDPDPDPDPDPVCGDGMVDAVEECDDGNTVSGDGCSNTCTVESIEFCEDIDQDGICDIDDLDNDNDGWSDMDEDSCITNPLDYDDQPLDDDGDGICNLLDDDPISSTSADDEGGSAVGNDNGADAFGGGNCSLNPNASADFSTFVFLALLCLTTPIAVTLHIRKRR